MVRRRALLIEANCFDENYDIVKHKILLPHPIAGAVKIRNEKITCKLMINNNGVEILVVDEEGHMERWRSENIKVHERL